MLRLCRPMNWRRSPRTTGTLRLALRGCASQPSIPSPLRQRSSFAATASPARPGSEGRREGQRGPRWRCACSSIITTSRPPKRTLREAARHGVQLILHGHRHQPFIGAEHVYAELESAEDPWELGRVGIIGAASAGSTAVKGGANGFNVIDIHPAQLDLTMFRAETREGSRGGFREVHRWSAALQRAESGKLVIGEWKREYEKDTG